MLYDYLQLDRQAAKPLYQQLYEQIRLAVQQGHLSRGEKMPSIRKLSQDLAVSRTTIEAAYQQLCVEGYLTSKPQSGYYVAAAGRPVAGKEPIVPRAAAAGETVLYHLGTDVVDRQSADITRWKRCVRDVLNRRDILVSYGEKQGEPALRDALSAYSFGVRGVISSPETVVIGAGTQPLLSILCGLLPKGGAVAMEEPGFGQAEQIFRDYGFPVVFIPSDQYGVSVNALKASGAAALYVSPSNRLRLGGSLPMERRFELLSWAREAHGLIIEDDYNGELRYSARPIPAMQSLSGGCGVAYLGSFSKLLLPSVRIGYLVLPQELREGYQKKAARYNQTASKIEQLALARYVREGSLERQLRRLRKRYALKSEEFRKSLRAAFGESLQISLWETGLCFRLWVDSRLSANELAALALKRGVRLTVREQNRESTLLAGFAGIPAEDIQSAVKELYLAWEPVLDREP